MSAIKLYVGNIPSAARNAELKELFEKFGKVIECDILKDYGFVHMEDTNDAKAAIAGLNDSLWKGSRIRVEISTTRTQKGEPSIRKRYRPPPSYRRSRSPPRGYPYRDAPPRFLDPYPRVFDRHHPYPEMMRPRLYSPPARELRMAYRGEPYSRRAYPASPPRHLPPRDYYRSRSRSPRYYERRRPSHLPSSKSRISTQYLEFDR
ncbi:RNA-binding 14 isoform X1, partial [Brachionus plicatilis]